MVIHPSIKQLSKRLEPFLPVPFIVAAAVYLLSLSRGVYPGSSAALTAAAAGLIPPSGAAHPVFAWVARGVAAGELFSLPVRLNLFPAFCGTLCAMLLYRLVSRMILFAACEDPGGGGRMDEYVTDTVSEMPPEVARYNLRMPPIAVAGGLIAAFLFIFTVPVWSAATRLENGLFDLLLALSALSLYPAEETRLRLPRLALSFFLFVLGLFDSAVFLLLLPCFAFLTLRDFVVTRSRTTMVCWLVAAGTAGAAFSVYAFWQNTEGLSAASLYRILSVYAHALPYQHYSELRAFFPYAGWALVTLQAGVPALFLLFGKHVFFKEKRANTLLVLLLVAVTVIPGLLNLPVAPFALFQPVGHLPVFGSALLAAAAASVIAACLIALCPADRRQDGDQFINVDINEQWQYKSLCLLAGVLLPVLLLLALITPLRSFHAVDARRGLFADKIARELLAVMKERTWLISNGYLDHHLLLQAHMLNKPLTIVTLQARAPQQEIDRLKSLIASSPVFEGQNRQRLQNALSIGTFRFVRDWFLADPSAGSRAMVFGTPDIWSACGYRAVPEGLAFGGVRPDQTVDLASIDQANQALTGRIMPFLAKQDKASGFVNALGEMLRMKAGLAANELGVLLEGMGEFEAAYQAYSRANRLDPMNLSAMINAHAVISTKKIHSEALDRLTKNIRAALSDRSYQGRGLTGISQRYGTIRQQAFYQQQAAEWSSVGIRAVASDKVRKALALSEQTGVAALIEKAMFYAQTEDFAKAEACYLSALEKDSKNREALTGIGLLMLSQRNMPEAEKWIQKALYAGVEKDALLYQTITLAIFKKETAQALDLLDGATKKFPEDVRYWTMLADVFLSQGDTQAVERKVLPEMQKVLKPANYFLIHAVRGFLLRKKGPDHFQEARLCLLKALSLNAALPDIWNVVIELDMAIGKPDFIESDVRNLLNLEPDHALANYLLGSLLLARRALLEAEDFLRRSIEKRPTAAACNDLGEDLRLQARLAEAETFVRQALVLEPGLLPALDTLACILFDLGRYEEAAQTAAKAVAARPSHAPYQLTLLRAQIRQGDKDGVAKRRQSLFKSNVPIPDALEKEMKEMK